jgi:ATP-binding cassette subfamily F protein 3
VKPFDGDMDDYRRLVLAGELEPAHRTRIGVAAPSASRTDDRRAAAARRSALAPVRKRLEAVEARIKRLSGAIAKIDAALADGSAFRADPAKAGDLARKRAEAAEALASAEEEWFELSGELETQALGP